MSEDPADDGQPFDLAGLLTAVTERLKAGGTTADPRIDPHPIIREELEGLCRDAEESRDEEERLKLAWQALTLWRLEAVTSMQWAFEIVQKNAPKQPSGQAWYYLQFLERVPTGLGWSITFLPSDLLAELIEALQALPFGEVQPILKPGKGSHGPAFSLGLVRLMAVEHVEFLAGKGLRKSQAREDVAAGLGVTEHNLRSWVNQLLPKAIGKEQLAYALRTAHEAGALAKTIERNGGREAWLNADLVDALERHESLDLAQLGRDMHSLQRWIARKRRLISSKILLGNGVR